MMISLGRKNDYGPAMPMGVSSSEPKESFPTMYFTSDSEIKLPASGKATVEFRKIKDSTETREVGAKPTYCYELEIRGIESGGKEIPVSDADEEDSPVDVAVVLKKNLRGKMKKE